MKKHKRNPKAQFIKEYRPKQCKPLLPDPEMLNGDRARWAAAALAEFRQQTGADLADAVSDLLADLMHWCDRFGQAFPQELRRARNHYAEETNAHWEMTTLLSDKL